MHYDASCKETRWDECQLPVRKPVQVSTCIFFYAFFAAPSLFIRAAVLSNQRVIDVLNVVVLFEFVDQGHDFVCLLFGQFGRGHADVFVGG